ncbi:MAG: hypothetical protein MJZ19_03590 [Paludibacteraceae bacterium]|nr:hypothetical protein [Paludibacteraceae bacterium]
MAEFDKIIVLSNGTEWCQRCWKAALDKHPIKFFNNQLPIENKKIEGFCRNLYLRYSFLRPILTLLFFLMLGIKTKENTLVIIYDWNILTMNSRLMSRIRRKTKLVYLFSNIVKITGATSYGILDNLKDNYDMVFAFDSMDAKKYGFNYHRLIYEKPSDFDFSGPKSDLFYVGQAKDRLGKLIEIFEKADSLGLKCDFHIAGVPEELQKHKDKIIYNENMSYDDVVRHICSSRCLVDVIQGESTGLTIKTCEAVIYNKKLITTNTNVVNEPYYKSSNIMVYDEHNCDIDTFLGVEMESTTEKDCYCFSVESLLNSIISCNK